MYSELMPGWNVVWCGHRQLSHPGHTTTPGRIQMWLPMFASYPAYKIAILDVGLP
jgi:hypothetical protein